MLPLILRENRLCLRDKYVRAGTLFPEESLSNSGQNVEESDTLTKRYVYN